MIVQELEQDLEHLYEWINDSEVFIETINSALFGKVLTKDIDARLTKYTESGRYKICAWSVREVLKVLQKEREDKNTLLKTIEILTQRTGDPQ